MDLKHSILKGHYCEPLHSFIFLGALRASAMHRLSDLINELMLHIPSYFHDCHSKLKPCVDLQKTTLMSVYFTHFIF